MATAPDFLASASVVGFMEESDNEERRDVAKRLASNATETSPGSLKPAGSGRLITAAQGHFAPFDVAMPELIDTFAAPHLVVQELADRLYNIKPGDTATIGLRDRLLRGVDEVLARQRAAEALGLMPADFAAITGETVFPAWLAELMADPACGGGFAVHSQCPWDAATLWGYTVADAAEAKLATPTAVMLDLNHRLGLTRIKTELMRRSGFQLQDILDLAKSQCFGQHLLITNETGAGGFAGGGLEGLRLLGRATQSPFPPLDEELCFALQAFLRLQVKLGWSTKKLDAAIVCLRDYELDMSPGTTRTGTPAAQSVCRSRLLVISPFVVQGLAALRQLSKLCGIEEPRLLPLWGPIDSHGEQSLLHREFLRPAFRNIDPIFAVSPDGQHLTEDGRRSKVNMHYVGLSASLNWPAEFLEDLLKATGLTNADLTVATLSALYRRVLLCRMLNFAPSQCVRFWHLFFAQDGDPLADPAATLAAVQQWRLLLDAGWTLDSLSAAQLGPQARATASSGVGLQTTATTLNSSKET